ncbi:hypothetical protein ACOI1C_14240 [Bacillus sp. DJP31]|uniref:hypothetical protein n=1 Tax=Bacillus sp. DJP31 TaxID=3409789 RepID=UPI003BB7D7B5
MDLTENQLRKYVNLGLLKTKRISSGPGKAGSIYPGDSIEIIKDIKKLQTSHSLKDILFILYFKGYEIDLEKLKQQLQTYYFNVLNDFQLIETNTNDPDDKQYYVEEYANKRLPKKKPGAPSQEEKRLEREKFNQLVTQINSSLSIIAEISKLGILTNQTMVKTAQSLDMRVDGVEVDFHFFTQWVNVEMWG